MLLQSVCPCFGQGKKHSNSRAIKCLFRLEVVVSSSLVAVDCHLVKGCSGGLGMCLARLKLDAKVLDTPLCPKMP